jgi:hypothetical protein
MASDQITPCPFHFLGEMNDFSCFLPSMLSLYDAFCSNTNGEREEKVNVKKRWAATSHSTSTSHHIQASQKILPSRLLLYGQNT